MNGSDLASEDLSQGADGILANGSEDGWTSKVPEFLGLDGEFSEEIFSSVDGFDIFLISIEREAVGFVECLEGVL